MLIIIAWFYTIVIFFLKITHWVDWSWWAVILQLPATYLLAGALLVLADAVEESANRRAWRKRQPYRQDVSHIEPLESIKNPGSRAGLTSRLEQEYRNSAGPR